MTPEEAKERNEMRGGNDDYSQGFLEGYKQGVKDATKTIDDYPDITVEDLARIKNQLYELLDEVKP